MNTEEKPKEVREEEKETSIKDWDLHHKINKTDKDYQKEFAHKKKNTNPE